jgi:diaminohydroxyphosphoribosylaminopyrimidine deaminase/5-amino-6-(5-phosphoribosylamino)uracil reductase
MQSIMDVETKYMQRCLQLALLGDGYTAPNPLVGAVVVHGDTIIGEGFHQHFGQAHAERNAIFSVKQPELLKNATLYVNLEPCSHYGKTPPCANLIIAKGIPRVVIGTIDPNPKVSGKGIQMLKDAGIETYVGVLEEKCRELNKRFFTFQEQKRPFIVLKWAQTIDGYIDRIRSNVSQHPFSISNEITRQLTHKMRSENQAIMVSTNTVLLDNPSLTVRNWVGKTPVRITLDRQGRIPQGYHLLDGSVPTLVFTEIQQPKLANVEYIQIDFKEEGLQGILKKIFERNIHSVLVEGGAQLLNSFIAENLWVEAYVEVAPIEIGSGITAPVMTCQPVNRKNFDGHEWLHYYNTKKTIK